VRWFSFSCKRSRACFAFRSNTETRSNYRFQSIGLFLYRSLLRLSCAPFRSTSDAPRLRRGPLRQMYLSPQTIPADVLGEVFCFPSEDIYSSNRHTMTTVDLTGLNTVRTRLGKRVSCQRFGMGPWSLWESYAVNSSHFRRCSGQCLSDRNIMVNSTTK
jgi:hypothetical protein